MSHYHGHGKLRNAARASESARFQTRCGTQILEASQQGTALAAEGAVGQQMRLLVTQH
jgi:hypothetical protein